MFGLFDHLDNILQQKWTLRYEKLMDREKLKFLFT